MNIIKFQHKPVLLKETMSFLSPQNGGIYVDGTLGGGGHSRTILEISSPEGIVIGIDKDEEAIRAARENLAEFGSRLQTFKADFSDLSAVLATLGQPLVDGILLDIGVSSYQLDTAERGFSYNNDAPLDMRMDKGSKVSAASLVASLPEDELAGIIYRYGEERYSRRIARAICRERADVPITTTGQLSSIIKRAMPGRARSEAQHPAKRTFQALRIAVNDELGALSRVLPEALASLKPGGRLAVITFHSLEDRIVKEQFRIWRQGCQCPPEFPVCVCGIAPKVKLLTGKPVTAGPEEIANNPRSRSAKLRAVEKL